MWRLLVWAWCLLLLSPSVAASIVRIEEVGLQGYYATEPTPTRVRVEVRNALAKPQSIELRFTVRDLVLPYYYDLNQKDTFSQTVELGPAQQRQLEVPLLISFAERPVLEVEERDAGGRVLANDRRVLDKPLSDELVAVVCAERAVCQAAQNQINFSGTSEEQTQKGKLFRFVTVREPPTVGWAYAAAHTVVLAAPVWRLTAKHHAALEEYLRQAGRLVLVEDEAGDSSFLAGQHRNRDRSFGPHPTR